MITLLKFYLIMLILCGFHIIKYQILIDFNLFNTKTTFWSIIYLFESVKTEVCQLFLTQFCSSKKFVVEIKHNSMVKYKHQDISLIKG